ncbi:MAG TPA: BrnT family toxin [Coxiellaceae bacterium]|nr:BrnT family toxin [Coxiellaceae bacterium]
MLDFEWDENKRLSNLKKHGVDFSDAIQVFEDVMRIEQLLVCKNEERYQVVGVVDEIVLFVVYTVRSHKKRIISARRASRNERRKYCNL